MKDTCVCEGGWWIALSRALLLSQQGGALVGAGRSQAEQLLLLCSGGGCLVQTSLPEGTQIWEKDLIIFPFIFYFQTVLKLYKGGFCWATPAVRWRVWVSFKRDAVLEDVEEQQCLGWHMEGEESRTGKSCRADCGC